MMVNKFGSKKLLAIDWDSRMLRMALVRSRADGIELQKAVSVPIPSELTGNDAESFGAFVREAIRQSHISASRAILSIPRDQVVLNTLSLPPTPPEELPALVQFQVVKELPFAVEQAHIDFAVTGEYDSKTTCKVLVAAVRSEVLSFYTKVVEEAGLTVERVGLRPHANLVCVLQNHPELADKSILIVDVGPLLTEINIVRSSALVFSRAASVHVPDFQAKQAGEAVSDSRLDMISAPNVERNESTQEAVARLMVEVIRSFEAYRATDSGATVEQIIVCGVTGLEAELGEAMGARFGTQVRLFSPERALSLTPQRAKELRGFSAPLGLAIGHGRRELENFDFLHPKKPISKRTLRLKKAPVAVMAAVLFIGAYALYYTKYVSPINNDIAKLKADIETDQKRKKPIQEFQKKVDAVEEWRTSEQYWPEVLTAMTNVFPPEEQAYVTRLDFDLRSVRKSSKRLGEVKLKLRTVTLGMVNGLSESLRNLGMERVTPGPESRISGERREDSTYHFDTSLSAEIPLRALRAPTPQAPSSTEVEPVANEDSPPANAEPAKSAPVKAEKPAMKPEAAKPSEPALSEVEEGKEIEVAPEPKPSDAAKPAVTSPTVPPQKGGKP